MIRVTRKKIEYIPIREVFNGVRIAFDYEPFYDNVDGEMVETDVATWTEAMIYPKPTQSQIKEFIINKINKDTEHKIMSTFRWRDIPVWLSIENQLNYKTTYDLAVQTNGEALPVVFKFGDEDNPQYFKFEDIETFQDFYFKVVEHINNTITAGWSKKDSINWDDYKL
jgi:hypothetical protein